MSRFERARLTIALLLTAAAAGLSPQAMAQFSDSYKFLQAVREGDGTVVAQYAEQPGVTLINTRDVSTGETALHITTGQRNIQWTRYLLSKGARPNIADAKGQTPLMTAIEKRWLEGIEVLIARNADVNLANSRGETPLIRAVQMKDLAIVRLLMAAGANPDKRDTLAGMSARDYAIRDARMPGIIEALSVKPKDAPKKATQGPSL